MGEQTGSVQMQERRKFSRKNRGATPSVASPDAVRPDSATASPPQPPVSQDDLALRQAKIEKLRQIKAAREQAALRAAEAEQIRQQHEAEIQAAKEQIRQAEDARKAAEEAAREALEQQQRLAELTRQHEDEARRAQEQAQAQARLEAEQAAAREAERLQAELDAQRAAQAAAEQARLEAEERAAHEQARQRAEEEHARAQAELRAQAEAEKQAEAERQAKLERAAFEAQVAAGQASERRSQDQRRSTPSPDQVFAPLEHEPLPPQSRSERRHAGRRTGDTVISNAPAPSVAQQLHANDPWSQLASIQLDPDLLAGNHIITAKREHHAHTAFDVLRTRLLRALSENNWRRVAITSAGKDVGKTFSAANLAITLSRQANCRTMLIDCDMRRPSLHRTLAVDTDLSLGDLLRGDVPPHDYFQKMGENSINAGQQLAFGLNSVVEPYASELLQDRQTQMVLDQIEATYDPDIMLFDMPPALFYDDVMAFRPYFDAVLFVVGGGVTSAKEIKEVERRLGQETPLLGVVLNMAEGTNIERYQY
jgi:Mrp family chromosome partitioning ATPase